MFKNNMAHGKDVRGSLNNVLETNPLNNTWEVLRFNCTAGPENIWKCYDCERRGDRKPGTIFIFEKRSVEKLHKPKRKETITEILRSSIRQLERFKHPKILQIYTSLEECSETIAFISEPIITNLANLFNKDVTNYTCINIEIKYGLLQLTEALQYLHYNCRIIHRNICPNSIFITKRCTWKLSGFEFIEKIESESETIQIQPWTSRLPKMAQPNLDFTAPEVQFDSTCSIYSDLFSLGLIILFVYNNGRVVLASNHSTSNYVKATEAFETEIKTIITTIPVELQEALLRLLSREPRLRPTSQLLSLIKYFLDSSVHTLQFLDIINMKDVNTKNNFYKSTLVNNLVFIPKKLWFQHIWPVLQHEMNGQEVLASVLQPIICIINECTAQEFNKYILPSFKNIFQVPKSIQATVTLLENLHIILDKIELNELENQPNIANIRTDIFNMLYNSLDSITIQVQNASLIAIGTVPPSNFDTNAIRKIVLPKVKLIYHNNTAAQGTQQDIKLIYNVLTCIENIIEFLIDRIIIIEDVLPILQDCSKLTDPDINLIVMRIYKVLLTNKKYGLTINLLATRVLPTLIPQTVNPNLNLEQFTTLIMILNEMLEYIAKNQRNKLKLDNNITSLQQMNKSIHPSGISTSLNMIKHQRSTDNIKIDNSMNRIDSCERKATSTENIITGNNSRKSSINVFGENFLRVLSPPSQQPYRRLSDNTLMGNSSPMVTPTIKICSTSLLSAENDTNLPTRRHSSICSQERKNSVATLAASSTASSRQASASASAVNSRRNSFLQPGQLFQQIGTGMFQLFNSGK